ncbi:MAG: hypothetical protein JO115_02715 [Pseudonocardiales bacterium]|nr:hypothetical protein [Pseudonocardiales bacterium]
MPYLISALAAATGVVVLVRLAGLVRRLLRTARRSRADWAQRTDLLAARTAELRATLGAALGRRHHRNEDGSPAAPAA